MKPKVISQTFEIVSERFFHLYKSLVLIVLKLIFVCRIPNFIVKI